MKRIFVALSFLFLVACGVTAFLWQQKLDGAISDANIVRMADNHYRVTRLNSDNISFYDMDDSGALTERGSVPRGDVRYLKMKWVDDTSFFISYPIWNVGYGTLSDGILWWHDKTTLSALIGQNISIYSVSHFDVSPQNSVLFCGTGTIPHSDGTRDRMAFVGEIDRAGNLLQWKMDTRMNNVEFKQMQDDGFIVQWQLDKPDADSEGFDKLVQKFDWQGGLQYEHTLVGEQDFKLALTDRIYIANRANQQESVSVYTWNNEKLFDFPVTSNLFSAFGHMKQTGSNELLLSVYYDVEKRTLDGQLLWHSALEGKEPADYSMYLDDGSNASVVNNYQSAVTGGGIDIRREENGSVLFKGYGDVTDVHHIRFQIFQPEQGKKKIIKQKGDIIHYRVESCAFWCSGEIYNVEPGVCRVYDLELLENGGLITLTSDCVDQQPENLVITRY